MHDNPCLPALLRHLGALHPGTAIERIDTHISTVLLVGQDAYKLKKPVRLPFLDFSTLVQRHHFVAEELRLNQRTAPGLYLDVLPVLGNTDTATLGTAAHAHQAIDWVLHMRRFPTQDVLAALADTGVLQTQHIDALAAHVAAFHQRLPTLSPDWHPHQPLAAWMLESCDEIASHPARPASLTPARLIHLRTQLQQQLQQLAPWCQQRQRSGHVRECHGDLHLGNLVLWQGAVVAFDALEFNADLRCIDVMNDTAFAFMDLLARGQSALAWRFINAYVERTGDLDGLRGLPLFTAYRALVRAKVALLSGDAPAVVEHYWALAERCLIPPATPPRLLLTVGLSGSGKSTVAGLLVAALAEHGIGAVRLRSDVERKRLHGLAATERPADPATLYAPASTARTYTHLQQQARALLQLGYWVVLDAACLRQRERAQLHTAAQQAQAGCALVECVADPTLLRARILARQQQQNDASDATPEVLAAQLAHAEPIPLDWPVAHHRIDNGTSLAELQHQVQQLVAQLVPPPAMDAGAGTGGAPATSAA